MKYLVKIIDFIFYKLKEPIKNALLKVEMSVLIYYFPFLGNWFTRGALKIVLQKLNDGTINPLMREMHYFSSVENGKIIIKRINDAQTVNDWNNAINSGMQPTNDSRTN